MAFFLLSIFHPAPLPVFFSLLVPSYACFADKLVENSTTKDTLNMFLFPV